MLPLEGIKVVDMAQVFMGPGAALYLGDQGAEVIKVEPLAGDSTRWLHTTPYLVAHGFSKPFLALNRNKRSIALQARSEEGLDIVQRLVRWADVFILNLRPGTEGEMRLDYESLAAINPRLIYVTISAFGYEGPENSLPGYDIIIQSRSGMLSTRRDSDGTPVPSVIMVSDISGCMSLSYAIMVALWERERTGKGQRIDGSLLHSGLAMQMQQLVWVENDNTPLPGQRPTALATCYLCADDRWITIVLIEHHQFKSLCRVMELEHLADDPRFVTYEQRLDQATELHEILEAIFQTRSLEEWIMRLRAAGVPCSPVVERGDVPDDPQTIANRMLQVQDHPAVGKIKVVSPPFNLSNTRDENRLRRPAPGLGEHTVEVLRDLGYDEESISILQKKKLVG
ncbi:MAG: CoA transferase [Dehalococcoidia bacterium]|nr:CoA transferase [Dehalococcoidia bacterium]